MSLGKKITLYVLLFSGIFTLVGTAIQLYLDYENDVEGLEATLGLIEKSHLKSLSQNVWSIDMDAVETQLTEMMNLPDMAYLELEIPKVSTIEKGQQPEPRVQVLRKYELFYDTTFNAERILVGTLTVAVTLENIYANLLDKLLVILLTQAIKVLFVSFFIVFLFYILVTRHLEKISAYLASTTLNSLSQPLQLNRREILFHNRSNSDELSVLVDSINSMRTELNEEIEAKQKTEQQLRQEIQERKQTQEALQRSQKMDAIGQMAGGIAHDFNNILGIVLGNLSFLKRQVKDNESALKRVTTANKAAMRAADLTKQLLGFSRRQAKEVSAGDIKQLIRNMDSLISRSITPEVEVEYRFVDTVWLTDIDPGDFEDVILNLVLNARDAMPNGGNLTFEIENKVLSADGIEKGNSIVPGEYIELAVSDTGCGISKADQERVFEPFFTTKTKGKGTGLGMSMIFGFTQRSKGHIKLFSELGMGTTIRLFLPRSSSEEVHNIVPKEEKILPRGRETILLVDDDPDLLEVAQQFLDELGYLVIAAGNGQEALEIIRDNRNINLLFSDVVMPGGLNGYELAEQARLTQPELKVLLTSGYTSRATLKSCNAKFQTKLLNKPYSQHDMAIQIRMLLDE